MLTSTTPTASAIGPTGPTGTATGPTGVPGPTAIVAPQSQPTGVPGPTAVAPPEPVEAPTGDSIALGLLWYAVGALAYTAIHHRTVNDIKTTKSGNGLFMHDIIVGANKIIQIDIGQGTSAEAVAKEQADANKEAYEEAVAMGPSPEAVRNGETEEVFAQKVSQAINKPFEDTEEPEEVQPEPTTTPIEAPEEARVEEPTSATEEPFDGNPIKSFTDLAFNVKEGGFNAVQKLVNTLASSEKGKQVLIRALKNKPGVNTIILSALSSPSTRKAIAQTMDTTKVSEKESMQAQSQVMALYKKLWDKGDITADDFGFSEVETPVEAK
jgi:hypothetical protein